MAALVCDICGGKLIVGAGGITVCDSCGMEYSVERMREKAYRSLDEAMLEGLQFTVIENVKKGFPIHEDSVKAYNFIAISY